MKIPPQLKRIKLSLRFIMIGFVVIWVIALSVGAIFFWNRYDRDLTKKISLIEKGSSGEPKEKISREKLEEIENTFETRKKKYQSSSSINVQEVFNPPSE